MEFTKDMEEAFTRLKTICSLKEGVNAREENERREILYCITLIQLEIKALPELPEMSARSSSSSCERTANLFFEDYI